MGMMSLNIFPAEINIKHERFRDGEGGGESTTYVCPAASTLPIVRSGRLQGQSSR